MQVAVTVEVSPRGGDRGGGVWREIEVEVEKDGEEVEERAPGMFAVSSSRGGILEIIVERCVLTVLVLYLGAEA